MKITQDSRKYGRVRVRGLLKYRADAEADKFQLMNIHEISEGGLSFLTNHKLESGTKLKISVLLLPKETPMDINAIVVRCVPKDRKTTAYQLSLRFLDMPEETRNTLREDLSFLCKNKKGSKSSRLVLRFRG